ncbi:hypothetical protein E2C01_013804 [Portunus trituberculatus]|uniref:Uncharacterized protein n=1 Tax=Portunus trituberculatus TaxID=210409 RepID=A0A5B7DH75_PORTR|nr:hypothetical protein [Portunus trituberculatus]
MSFGGVRLKTTNLLVHRFKDAGEVTALTLFPNLAKPPFSNVICPGSLAPCWEISAQLFRTALQGLPDLKSRIFCRIHSNMTDIPNAPITSLTSGLSTPFLPARTVSNTSLKKLQNHFTTEGNL